MKVGDVVRASVDPSRRIDIIRNHSATHLLHSALRKVLGDHVLQKGSLVADDRLRFDFSHGEPLSRQQILDIECLVNEQILNNKETEVQVMSLEKAKASGAMAVSPATPAAAVRKARRSKASCSHFLSSSLVIVFLPIECLVQVGNYADLIGHGRLAMPLN